MYMHFITTTLTTTILMITINYKKKKYFRFVSNDRNEKSGKNRGANFC